MSRLRRFLHLERPRPAASAGEAAPAPARLGRFGGVARPGEAPGAPSSSGAELDRFGPEPEPRLELVETEAGERPFTRCMRCGMDHNVFATSCESCGASLDTEAQRAFNESLWARRREEAAREAAAEAERKELQARAERELAAARRGMAEELAREVGRRERARLDTGGWGRGGLELEGAGRLLRRLLRRFRG